MTEGRARKVLQEQIEKYGQEYDAEGIEALKMAIKALEQTMWIPIKTRPMTEEEKEEIGHEYAYIYVCPLPDDGQEVLITDCYGNVEIDTFCRDDEGVYFENNCDDGEVVAWQPLPQPYKAESEEATDSQDDYSLGMRKGEADGK